MRRLGFWGRVRYVWDAIRVAFGAPRGSNAWRAVTGYRRLPDGPPPEAIGAAMRRLKALSPPDDELGVAVDLRRVLVATPDAVVALTGCSAYSTGFQLHLVVRRRDDPVPQLPPGPRYRPPEMDVRLGIRFADGRHTAGSDREPAGEILDYHRAVAEGREPALPAGPVIGQTGGGGGGRRWDMNYWVWPLPPDGPVTVTCEWPQGAVEHGETHIDGTAIRRAGESSAKLWRE